MRRTRGRGGNNHGNGQSQNQNYGGNRRSQTPSRHQVFDSNGPDVRIRGNAMQVWEKYQNLARDAASAGDRVKAESYMQHAEHYYRIVLAIQEATGETYQPRPANGEAVEGEAQTITDSSNQDPAQMPQPSTEPLDMSQQPQPEAAVA